MFYSHEILENPKHGVTTIWLVATAATKSRSSKISRKAIQDVNVEKACRTILKPGAPIALRLQGSLLYGVSRVYSQQCGYVLTDAERVQTRMRAFYGTLGTGGDSLDPLAGKAKRSQLILVDDPDLVQDLALVQLPPLLLEGDYLNNKKESQESRKTSSQMSPLESSQFDIMLTPSRKIGDFLGSSRGKGHSLLGRDWPHMPGSSSRGGSNQLQEPFGHDSIHSKPDVATPFGLDGAFDEPFIVMDDLGLEIDVEGNIVDTQIGASPQLPSIRGLPSVASPATAQAPRPKNALDQDGELLMNLGEEELPAAEAFGAQTENKQEVSVLVVAESEEFVVAPARRKRRRPELVPDSNTKIAREEFKGWNDNYVANMETAHRRAKTTTHITPAQAKDYAWDTMFGTGIMSIGLIAGHSGYEQHPLAQEFSGATLKKHLINMALGRPFDFDEPGSKQARTASEALSDDEEEVARRKSPRLGQLQLVAEGQGEQTGRAAETDDFQLGLDQEEPEQGREQPVIPAEGGSDFMPWNRSSMLIPGSDTRKSKMRRAGSESSPLQHRGSMVPDIERYSDHAPPALGSDGFGAETLGSADNSFNGLGPDFGMMMGDVPLHEESQAMRAALDQQGLNFLDYVEAVAKDEGVPRYDANDVATHWLTFDSLFDSGDRKRVVAAQAFYHVLGLATKNIISVEQDGQGGTAPFGEIRLGMKVNIEEGTKGKQPAPIAVPGSADDAILGSSPPLMGPMDEVERIKRSYQALVDEDDEDIYGVSD